MIRMYVKALVRQLLGAKYENVTKGLFAAGIIYFSFAAAGIRIPVSEDVLFLTSVLLPFGFMLQMLSANAYRHTFDAMLVMPHKPVSLVFSLVTGMSLYVIAKRMLPVWALLLAVSPALCPYTIYALSGTVAACILTSVFYCLCHQKHLSSAVLLTAAAAWILFAAGSRSLPFLILFVFPAGIYLSAASPYLFSSLSQRKKTRLPKKQKAGILTYLFRSCMSCAAFRFNTIGLCAAALFLPVLLTGMKDLSLFPFGLVILSVNTPLTTVLSADRDLDQAVRILPDQRNRFFLKYVIFTAAVLLVPALLYLISWQIQKGGPAFLQILTVFFFTALSSVLSVFLEWKFPIHSWKTESDLWHHPRKYIIPAAELLLTVCCGIMRM